VWISFTFAEGGLKQFNSIGDRQQPYNEMLVRMTELVDHVLIEDDTNGDGYIDIQEFLNSHDL
jgi:hypothetical protein